ncbi:hypothetical protein HanIR_Chr03g0133181 [Helianthus annuus]|nr:hypothetical protein HanIR_Chr03g0133181 [Helianthus annuus]
MVVQHLGPVIIQYKPDKINRHTTNIISQEDNLTSEYTLYICNRRCSAYTLCLRRGHSLFKMSQGYPGHGH